MSNNRIVLASVLLVAVGLMALNPSTMMIGKVQAQTYDNQYGYENNYYKDDNRYSYDKKDPMSSHTDIQKIKCVNSNINVNGIDVTEVPQDGSGLAVAVNEGAGTEGANTQNGNGLADRINFDRNLVNICVNYNQNDQLKVSSPEDPTCEECFTNELDQTQIDDLFPIVINRITINDVQQLCDRLEALTSTLDKQNAYATLFNALDEVQTISNDERDAILNCLINLGLIIFVT